MGNSVVAVVEMQLPRSPWLPEENNSPLPPSVFQDITIWEDITGGISAHAELRIIHAKLSC